MAAGALQTMITNYWLGTFNLLTLQFVTVVTTLQYVIFMAVGTRISRRAGSLGFLVFPAAWVLFDWLRSLGFLGYPWAMLGTSQYPVIPLIQVSALTGVWGVTFIVTLVNSVAAWTLLAAAQKRRIPRAPLIALACVLTAALGWGGARMLRDARLQEAARRDGPSGARSVRLALVQQNADPRKDDYEAVYQTLKRLTESVLSRRAGHGCLVRDGIRAQHPALGRRGARQPPLCPAGPRVACLAENHRHVAHHGQR